MALINLVPFILALQHESVYSPLPPSGAKEALPSLPIVDGQQLRLLGVYLSLSIFSLFLSLSLPIFLPLFLTFSYFPLSLPPLFLSFLSLIPSLVSGPHLMMFRSYSWLRTQKSFLKVLGITVLGGYGMSEITLLDYLSSSLQACLGTNNPLIPQNY